MTSPTSAASATPPAPRSRLHWSVAAPLSAAAGVGSAVFGALADMPLLGLAGAVVAAVPAVLAARYVPALQAELAAHRARASRSAVTAPAAPAAPVALPGPEPVPEPARVRPFVAPTGTTRPTTVDLVTPSAPAQSSPPAPVVVPVVEPQHATVGGARATSAASTASALESGTEAQDATHARVDTAELQLIWDLGEASRSRSGRGRRARTGAEVDALPDRPRSVSSPRRRARHRA